MPKRIVFMGTPQFAVPALAALCEAGHEVVAVFTQPDRPAGRGRRITASPVKLEATRLLIPVRQPQSLRDPEAFRWLSTEALDAIVVAAYAQLLPQAILELPRFGCLNIHASLLPKYRGGAPIHWAIVNGEKETGVTIMHMDKGLDTGDIIIQRRIPIATDDTCGEVTERLAREGAALITEVLGWSDLGQSRRRAQTHSEMTYARNVQKNDGRILWSSTRKQIHDLVRGMNPWPGAYCLWQGAVLKINTTGINTSGPNLDPATWSFDCGSLWVGCQDGSIEVLQVQPQGKRTISAADFYRGYLTRSSQNLFS